MREPALQTSGFRRQSGSSHPRAGFMVLVTALKLSTSGSEPSARLMTTSGSTRRVLEFASAFFSATRSASGDWKMSSCARAGQTSSHTVAYPARTAMSSFQLTRFTSNIALSRFSMRLRCCCDGPAVPFPSNFSCTENQ